VNISQQKSMKKPYRTPQVVLYGDIREITKTAKKDGHADRTFDDPDQKCDGASNKTGPAGHLDFQKNDGRSQNMCKTG
jgi:hypothetical protein